LDFSLRPLPGSCRGIYSKPPYTEYISTRWYRAPECLLTDGYYDYKMDLWGIGCVFFEVVALFPLFPGSNELDQIEKIHAVMGTPSKELQLKFKRYAFGTGPESRHFSMPDFFNVKNLEISVA
jgi:renal tumor antigen